MKNNKTILLIISGIIVFIILGIGFYFNSEKFYTAADVLEDVDFSVKESSVEFKKIDAELNFVPIKLTDKTQQELIKAFEKSKFKKDDNSRGIASNNYWLRITLNRGYVMYLDLNKKQIAVADNVGSHEGYLFEDDKGFFSILEKAVTE